MPINALSQWGITALLFAVLGGLIWKNVSVQPPAQNLPPAPFDQRFTDFTARAFNPAGALAWTLTGSTLTHLTSDQGYQIRSPDFLMQARDADTPPWRLTAPTGTANEPLSEVLLEGGVEGSRAAFNSKAKGGMQGAIKFTTAALTLKPKQQMALSQDPTHFAELDRKNQPLWTSDSTGFSLNYAANLFKQDSVRDQYNRPKIEHGSNQNPGIRTNANLPAGAQP
ncbi:MAG: LPS export ABC transporter periplasmic protein LptC [Halothiobacillus sp.]